MAGFLAASLVRRLLNRLLKRAPNLTDEVRLLISRAVGWVLILMGVLYAVFILNFDFGPALVAILVLGVVVFFAGRGLMEEFAAGMVLQGTPMFAPGDLVELVEGTGIVKEITGRNVVLDTVDGKRISVPNTSVISNPVTNYTQRGARRTTLMVHVAYGTDLDRAKDVLEATAAISEGVHEDPTPEALATKFGKNAIDFRLRYWTDPLLRDEARTQDVVGRAIAKAFGQHGIEIPFPQRTLWWGQSEVGEVPPEQ